MSLPSISLYPAAEDLINRSVMITGTARSGTRILGSLFQSLEDTEYLFEPPMLFCLIPLIHDLPPGQWKFLFESFLVEEFLLGAMAGRFINLNENDYSYIYKSKPRAEVDARLSRTFTRIECLENSPGKRIVAKVPAHILSFAPMLDMYPGMTVIVMLRNPDSVIGSFVRKGWFSDRLLKGPLNYPPYKVVGEYYLPAWVADADLERFIQMNEVSRGAYYYLRMYGGVPERENVLVVNYDDFVRRPRDIFEALCRHVGGCFSTKTEEVLGMVREPAKKRDYSWDGVANELRDRVYDAARKLEAKAIG